jgi:hypothetical protein
MRLYFRYIIIVFIILLITGLFCQPVSGKVIRFSGIGTVVSRGTGGSVIVDGVFRESPAFDIVSAGDEIISFNGQKSSNLTLSDIRRFTESSPGTSVSLVIRRDGKQNTVNLVSAMYDITPATLPEYSKTQLRIVGFDSSNVIRARFTGAHNYKRDDVFLLFEDQKLLCQAKIQHFNNETAQLLITEKWGDVHSYNAYKYQLFYCGSQSYEKIRKEGDFLGELGALTNKRVSVTNYWIGIDDDRQMVAGARVLNLGDLPVTDIIITCRFVDYFGRLIGKDVVVYSGTLNPGKTVEIYFRSGRIVNEKMSVRILADHLLVHKVYNEAPIEIVSCKFDIDPDIQVIIIK